MTFSSKHQFFEDKEQTKNNEYFLIKKELSNSVNTLFDSLSVGDPYGN